MTGMLVMSGVFVRRRARLVLVRLLMLLRRAGGVMHARVFVVHGPELYADRACGGGAGLEP